VLARLGAWNVIKPRATYVRPEQLKAWCTAVEGLEGDIPKDALMLLILTGLRKTEALSLAWQHVDLVGNKLTVPETKNGKAHVLPISAPLAEMLKRRAACKTSGFVFPGSEEGKHFMELKRSIKQVTQVCGVKFSTHDLRRSFAVYGEILELSAYTLKRLLNHSSGGDVTMHHYLPLEVERLRKPMERIANFVLSHAEKLEGEKIVQLPIATAA